MSRRKRRRRSDADGAKDAGARQAETREPDGPTDAGSAEEQVSVGEWQDRASSVRRTFPGPHAVDVPLRVAVERDAYAEVVAHAKDSLDAEICGVLLGAPCRDDEGPFVHVQASVRGSRAEHGSAHVTYTQETWNAIYETIERDYSKLQIVGWYHSHPGFGVEFSDMDVFIQKNFFSGPTQIGLVTDPLGGDVAVCINRCEGTRYLKRFWVDGREHRCYTPSGNFETVDSSSSTGSASSDAIASLETRISQLIATMDEMRRSFYRWVTTLGMLAGLAVMFFIARQVGYMIFGEIPEPPRNMSFARIPVVVEGEPCLLGVNVVRWKIPPELIAVPKTEEEGTEKEGDQKKGKTAPEVKKPKRGPPSSKPSGEKPQAN